MEKGVDGRAAAAVAWGAAGGWPHLLRVRGGSPVAGARPALLLPLLLLRVQEGGRGCEWQQMSWGSPPPPSTLSTTSHHTHHHATTSQGTLPHATTRDPPHHTSTPPLFP